MIDNGKNNALFLFIYGFPHDPTVHDKRAEFIEWKVTHEAFCYAVTNWTMRLHLICIFYLDRIILKSLQHELGASYYNIIKHMTFFLWNSTCTFSYNINSWDFSYDNISKANFYLHISQQRVKYRLVVKETEYAYFLPNTSLFIRRVFAALFFEKVSPVAILACQFYSA